jgi:hypothetical protein
VFIRAVDEGLERLLRTRLPLPAEDGEISFDAPTPEWAATVSQPTVNLFLYDVAPSPNAARSGVRRVDVNGRPERRAPPPVMQLGYLISTWGASALEQHRLLGEVLNRLAGLPNLPGEYITTELSSNVMLAIGEDRDNFLRQIWRAAGGMLRASFTLQVTVAADAFDWVPEPPAPEAVIANLSRQPRP